MVTSQHRNGPAGSVAYREYLIDVRPAGGSPPFRTKLGVSYYGGGEATDRYKRFSDGDVFPVRCDAKREKAKWDYDDPRIYKDGQSPKERKESKKQPSEFDVAAAQPPGTPVKHDSSGGDRARELARRGAAMLDQLADDSSGGSSRRSIRARVTYREVVSGETKTQTIVQGTESRPVISVFDLEPGDSTVESAKGKALLGRATGDRVMLPQGRDVPPIEVEIVSIDESGA